MLSESPWGRKGPRWWRWGRWQRCVFVWGPGQGAGSQALGALGKVRKKARGRLFPPGFEPGTFRVLGERDNHYTTETDLPELFLKSF